MSEKDAPRRGETVLNTLSRPPQRRWPDAFLHHGARAALFLGLAVVLALLFPPPTGFDVDRYEVGMVAPEAIIAQVPFGVPKPPEELEGERAAAAAAVPPTFRSRPGAADSMAAALEEFFDRLDDAREDEDSGAVQAVLADVGIVASPRQRELLREPGNVNLLRDASLRATREILPQGVAEDAARPGVPTTQRIVVRGEEGEDERYVPRDSILTTQQFFERATDLLPATVSPDLDELLRLALIRFVRPSLSYDAETTEEDRDAARRSVSTVKETVLAGEAIVRANQQVGESELDRIRAYEEELRNQGLLEADGFSVLPFLGSVILNALVLGIFWLLLLFFRPEIHVNFRWLLLQAALILAFFGAGGLIHRYDFPVELLPVAFVTLAVAVLWDGRLALFVAFILAGLTGGQAPFSDMGAWLPVLVAGSAAALSVRAVRRRAQTWMFIALILASYVGVLAALGLTLGRDPGAVALSMGWAGMNTVASAILAMGFLPVFEWFTRITTDQTLLEWADPNRPLLKRLSLEAPGTYAHTINVANLSEAAANAIGANGLLCRVGVYYHDVGKMIKPQYFIENQPGGRNPHDKLKPETSAAIVREHVTEGLRLAREAKLPDVLADFIPEHHGDQEISFFFQQAREQGKDGAGERPEFRYPGPRPRSRETAIVMLADSVESATRSLKDPTPQRIRELIDNIVEAKIGAGQLDNAPLTLREIGIIKKQFEKVLTGMYHHRIDYPATRHLTEAAPAGGGGVPTGEEMAGAADSPAEEDTSEGESRAGPSEDGAPAPEPASTPDRSEGGGDR